MIDGETCGNISERTRNNGKETELFFLLRDLSTQVQVIVIYHSKPKQNMRRISRRPLQMPHETQLCTLLFLFLCWSSHAGHGQHAGHEGHDNIQLSHECRKTLWLSGMQLGDGKGGQAQYIGGSKSYMESYLIALASAAKHAPSLVPVIAIQGDIDDATVRHINALGGHVVHHRLSFMDTLLQHRPNTASGLLGSYLRVDVAPIVATARAAMPGRLDNVDTDYVLWTDPDVLFYGDIDSCTLPKPRYVSVGPDSTHHQSDNCGVVYYNVSGFDEVHDDMVRWAAKAHGFNFFVADQDMMNGYFGRENRNFMQHLPDTFNWKPYWYDMVVVVNGCGGTTYEGAGCSLDGVLCTCKHHTHQTIPNNMGHHIHTHTPFQGQAWWSSVMDKSSQASDRAHARAQDATGDVCAQLASRAQCSANIVRCSCMGAPGMAC